MKIWAICLIAAFVYDAAKQGGMAALCFVMFILTFLASQSSCKLMTWYQ